MGEERERKRTGHTKRYIAMGLHKRKTRIRQNLRWSDRAAGQKINRTEQNLLLIHLFSSSSPRCFAAEGDAFFARSGWGFYSTPESRGLFFISSFDKGLLYYHSAASCVHNLMDFARPTSSRWRIELRLDLHMCWDGMRWDGWKAMLVSNVQQNQHYGNGIHNSFLCCPLFVFHAAHYIISSATACIVRSFVALLLAAGFLPHLPPSNPP